MASSFASTDNTMSAELERFYGLIERLGATVSGFRRLRRCSGRDGWPLSGVYYFFDQRESRGDGSGSRVVRVGTHGLTPGSGSSLWGRLRQHRGTMTGGRPGGGNHRASVFRYHVGGALLARDGDPGGLLATWLARRLPRSEVAEPEHETEVRVSEYIGDLPFLWLAVEDGAERGWLERSSIGLLTSEDARTGAPSAEWLGRHAQSQAILSSGLWNVNHVGKAFDQRFLDTLEERIGGMA